VHAVVSRLTVYPVKSFAGHVVDAFEVGVDGPVGDRRWMVVDERGDTLTARKFPQMLGAQAEPVDGGLRLMEPSLGPLDVAEPVDGPVVAVTASRLDSATDAGDDAAAWCSEIVGRRARLVWLDDTARRGMSEKHGGTATDPISLVDTAPLHVFSTASLRQVSVWAEQSLDVRRFRPNVVVDGDLQPFAEDGWERFALGPVHVRFAEHTGRCVMTTVDPDTFVKGKEPLRALARHRRWDGEVRFGIQAVPLSSGRVSVGDPVVTG